MKLQFKKENIMKTIQTGTVHTIQQSWELYKNFNDLLVDEVAKRGTADPLTIGAVEKLSHHIDDLWAKINICKVNPLFMTAKELENDFYEITIKSTIPLMRGFIIATNGLQFRVEKILAVSEFEQQTSIYTRRIQ
jgi:hypothetical protein